LDQEDTKRLKQVVSILGGQLVDRADDHCSHLVMSKIKVTAKVIGAQVTGLLKIELPWLLLSWPDLPWPQIIAAALQWQPSTPSKGGCLNALIEAFWCAKNVCRLCHAKPVVKLEWLEAIAQRVCAFPSRFFNCSECSCLSYFEAPIKDPPGSITTPTSYL
jgi:hypothetical protein